MAKQHPRVTTTLPGPTKPWYTRWWAIAAFVVVAIMIVSSLTRNASDSTQPPAGDETRLASPAATPSPTPSAATEPSPTVDAVLTRGEVGDAWPLSVDEVRFICERPHRLLVRANGKVYTLNGTAKGAYPDRPNIREIWLKDPHDDGLRINIGPVLTAGLKYCGWN